MAKKPSSKENILGAIAAQSGHTLPAGLHAALRKLPRSELVALRDFLEKTFVRKALIETPGRRS